MHNSKDMRKRIFNLLFLVLAVVGFVLNNSNHANDYSERNRSQVEQTICGEGASNVAAISFLNMTGKFNGKLVGKCVGIGAAGIVVDWVALYLQLAYESRYATMALNVVSSALEGASVGGLVGSVVPVVGTTAGGIAGAVLNTCICIYDDLFRGFHFYMFPYIPFEAYNAMNSHGGDDTANVNYSANAQESMDSDEGTLYSTEDSDEDEQQGWDDSSTTSFTFEHNFIGEEEGDSLVAHITLTIDWPYQAPSLQTLIVDKLGDFLCCNIGLNKTVLTDTFKEEDSFNRALYVAFTDLYGRELTEIERDEETLIDYLHERNGVKVNYNFNSWYINVKKDVGDSPSIGRYQITMSGTFGVRETNEQTTFTYSRNNN